MLKISSALFSVDDIANVDSNTYDKEYMHSYIKMKIRDLMQPDPDNPAEDNHDEDNAIEDNTDEDTHVITKTDKARSILNSYITNTTLAADRAECKWEKKEDLPSLICLITSAGGYGDVVLGWKIYNLLVKRGFQPLLTVDDRETCIKLKRIMGSQCQTVVNISTLDREALHVPKVIVLAGISRHICNDSTKSTKTILCMCQRHSISSGFSVDIPNSKYLFVDEYNGWRIEPGLMAHCMSSGCSFNRQEYPQIYPSLAVNLWNIPVEVELGLHAILPNFSARGDTYLASGLGVTDKSVSCCGMMFEDMSDLDVKFAQNNVELSRYTRLQDMLAQLDNEEEKEGPGYHFVYTSGPSTRDTQQFRCALNMVEASRRNSDQYTFFLMVNTNMIDLYAVLRAVNPDSTVCGETIEIVNHVEKFRLSSEQTKHLYNTHSKLYWGNQSEDEDYYFYSGNGKMTTPSNLVVPQMVMQQGRLQVLGLDKCPLTDVSLMITGTGNQLLVVNHVTKTVVVTITGLDKTAMQFYLKHSRNECLLTGDQSFTEGINLTSEDWLATKIVFLQVHSWKINLVNEFVKLLDAYNHMLGEKFGKKTIGTIVDVAGTEGETTEGPLELAVEFYTLAVGKYSNQQLSNIAIKGNCARLAEILRDHRQELLQQSHQYFRYLQRRWDASNTIVGAVNNMINYTRVERSDNYAFHKQLFHETIHFSVLESDSSSNEDIKPANIVDVEETHASSCIIL